MGEGVKRAQTNNFFTSVYDIRSAVCIKTCIRVRTNFTTRQMYYKSRIWSVKKNLITLREIIEKSTEERISAQISPITLSWYQGLMVMINAQC